MHVSIPHGECNHTLQMCTSNIKIFVKLLWACFRFKILEIFQVEKESHTNKNIINCCSCGAINLSLLQNTKKKIKTQDEKRSKDNAIALEISNQNLMTCGKYKSNQ